MKAVLAEWAGRNRAKLPSHAVVRRVAPWSLGTVGVAAVVARQMIEGVVMRAREGNASNPDRARKMAVAIPILANMAEQIIKD